MPKLLNTPLNLKEYNVKMIEKENVKTFEDDFNPRLFAQEFRCHKCRNWFPEDEIQFKDNTYTCLDCLINEDEI